MKFFIDTANLDQIREAQDLGVLDGVTTNPSLMAKEGITGTDNIMKHYIDICNIVEGDVIIGLESFGQASYETEYNGGMGSNGLTSARHDVFSKYLAEKYPESFDAAVPEELVYSGQTKLTDTVENCLLYTSDAADE